LNNKKGHKGTASKLKIEAIAAEAIITDAKIFGGSSFCHKLSGKM